jgi:FKBP-type peptidyl-prolyl cis-trans isomerase 2
MLEVKNNDYVTVIYDGFLNNDEVFESSKDTGPMEFQVGTNSVLPGFENAVLGMKMNETKNFEIQPQDAFGIKKPELVHTVERAVIGADAEVKPGAILGLTVEKDGENVKVPAMVTDVTDDTITVDFNHPLAGQTLKYQVTVTAISERPAADAGGCGCGCGDDHTQTDDCSTSGCNSCGCE